MMRKTRNLQGGKKLHARRQDIKMTYSTKQINSFIIAKEKERKLNATILTTNLFQFFWINILFQN
jgi:hypothetical protein